MSPSAELAHRLLHLGFLRCASLLVPRRQRDEWWREWRGELWYVGHACTPRGAVSWQGQQEVTRFCLGAFQDALWMRRSGRQPGLALAAIDGTARQCILILAGILTASYAASLLLPGVQAERALWPRKVTPNLVLILRDGSNGEARPTISPAQFLRWQGRKQRYFDGFAFYRVAPETIDAEFPSGGSQTKSAWGVARASSNLFTLLGLPVELGAPDGMKGSDLPAVILSERLWKSDFGAERHLSGMIVHLGHRAVRIAGVAPDGSLGLPGR